MNALHDLIRRYRILVEQEAGIAQQKEALRRTIMAELGSQKLSATDSPFGSARITARFRVLPHNEPILALLQAPDLLPFAQFTSKRVTELLVPKYGRERLMPLFDVQRIPMLVVRGPQKEGRVATKFNPRPRREGHERAHFGTSHELRATS